MLRWILLPLLLPVRMLMYLWFKVGLVFLRGNVLFHSLPEKFTSTLQSGLLYRILNKQEMLWFHYLGFLSRLSRDRGIQWVLLSIPDVEELDWSQIEEIRIRLEEIKKSGKRLVGHVEKGGLKTLCLLSACERRYLAPGISFITALPYSEPFFFAATLKKLGIRVEVHTAGEFKSAGESVSRQSMSPAAKSNLEELLDARTAGILSGIDALPAPGTLPGDNSASQSASSGSRSSEKNTVVQDSQRKKEEYDNEQDREQLTKKLHDLIRNRSFLESEELRDAGFASGLVARANFRDLCEDLLPFWHTGTALPSDSSIDQGDRLPLLQLEGITVTDAPVSHAFPGKAEKTMNQIAEEQLARLEKEGAMERENPGSDKGHAKDRKKNRISRKKKAKGARAASLTPRAEQAPSEGNDLEAAEEKLKKAPAFRILEMDQVEKRFQRSRFNPLRIKPFPSVALVSCEGMIVWGDEDPDSGRIGALSMRRIFRDLEDSKNEAVFLYINSPGGLSDACEALYQDIYRLSRAKPVFAVIGPVAASGGYYMACAANRIYSPDLSLTGSVGVLRMRPELSGLYSKLGIKKQRVRFGPTTDILSESGNLGKKSQALLDESMDRSYNLFLDRVGRNRGLNRQEADLRGRGKVYTGAQFREEGMVDRKGGFIEAFRDFRKEAGFGEQMFDIQIYPVLRPGPADLLRQGSSFLSFKNQKRSELFSGQNLYMAHPDSGLVGHRFAAELRRAGIDFIQGRLPL